MPQIQAFHGIRYDLGHVGSLSNVIAPPYDVINEEMQKELYKKHPANSVRLILNRQEPGDGGDERYARAASFLKNWQREGVLQKEAQAAIYCYQQSFSWEGTEYTRSGFLSRVRLEPFGTGTIYAHEETHSAAKVDRLKLFHATKANLSPVFGVFPDERNDIRNLLDQVIAGKTPLEATDHLGVVHRMWPIVDVQVITELTALMGPRPTFVADGHHRYETACNYRQALADAGELADDHPANFVLMMCIGMSDPGMIVLPTHRLFRGLPQYTSEQIVQKIGDCFETRPGGQGAEAAGNVWEDIVTADAQGTLGLFTAKDQQWTLATITDTGRRRLAELAAEKSDQWRGLGVSILHRLLIEEVLEGKDLPKPMYVHAVDELVEAIQQGDTTGRDATGQMGQGGQFPLAALVMPATLDHVRAISEQGERMPAKSTYFYPKLLSGLVFNPLQ